ncbi:hypothetical protein H4R20_002862 [Coemansia guatemalensis]|uniref:LIM zinc-binding domain-containing protein n=1 Tax=Coemansia guatemalensis TaxID=2761395 RepID=A0A9W8I0P5_9FUNG|nr:hypothetical protein H4R20_002862 [Coemansia guatemalensis]
MVLDVTTMVERSREIYCRGCSSRISDTTAAPASGVAPTPSSDRQTAVHSEWSERDAGSSGYRTPPRSGGYAGVVGGHKPVEISPSSVFVSGRRNINLPANHDICPRCNKTIYHAEKVVGPGGPWHRQCFKCKQCGTTLNSTKLTEHEGEAFCQTCYTKLFSPRGYNIGGSTEPLPYQSRPQLPPRSPTEHIKKPPRASSSLAGAYPRTALSPVRSPFGSAAEAAATAAVVGQSRSPTMALRSSPTVTRTESTRSRLSFGRPYTPRIPADFGVAPPDICPRCNGRIYAAEQAMAAGRKYHKFCIKCKACNTSINSLQITERDGEIFCRPCYAKNFGPKGFRQTLGTSINEY